MFAVSAVLFVLAAACGVLDYYIYHFLEADLHFGKQFHEKPVKPFLANLFGLLTTDLLAGSIIFLVCGLFLKNR